MVNKMRKNERFKIIQMYTEEIFVYRFHALKNVHIQYMFNIRCMLNSPRRTESTKDNHCDIFFYFEVNSHFFIDAVGSSHLLYVINMPLYFNTYTCHLIIIFDGKWPIFLGIG